MEYIIELPHPSAHAHRHDVGREFASNA